MIQFLSYVMVYSAQDSQGVYILRSIPGSTRNCLQSICWQLHAYELWNHMNQNDTKELHVRRWPEMGEVSKSKDSPSELAEKFKVFGSAHSTFGTERTSPWSDNHRIPKKH